MAAGAESGKTMGPRIFLAATENWPNAAHYAEGFHVAGCNVSAFAPQSACVQSSGFVSERFFYNPLAPVPSLRAALETAEPVLIVSCDERALKTLLTLYRSLDERSSSLATLIERSLGEPARYPSILSRSDGLTAMREAGVRVPATLPVESEAMLDACIGEIGLPAVVKADETCGGQGVAVVRSQRDAHWAYRRLAAPSRLRTLARFARSRDVHFLLDAAARTEHKISVQAFVEGSVAASAFASDAGKVIAGFAYDVLDAEKGGLGPPRSIRRIDCPEIDAATRVVASHFHLTGAHGLDFIRDRSGAAHLIEINPRATRGGTLPFGVGRDLPYGLATMLGAEPKGIRTPLTCDVVDFSARSNPRSFHSPVKWPAPGLSTR